MKFYNDFNAMFNAQSGLKKDMSVFNNIHSIFGAGLGERGCFAFIEDYPDLRVTLGFMDDYSNYIGYNTATNKYFHIDLSNAVYDKLHAIYTAFADCGKVDDFMRVFPIATNGRLKPEWYEPPEIWVNFDNEKHGDLQFVATMSDSFHDWDIDMTIPVPELDYLDTDHNTEEYKDAVSAAAFRSSGAPEKFRDMLAKFQQEAERIKNFDINAYFGNKQYDLTKPWKEKFMMPVD